MKSIKQQYIDLKEGRMSQHNFMRSVRMSMPQYITNVTSFNDTVKILKNKGILNEAESINFRDPQAVAKIVAQKYSDKLKPLQSDWKSFENEAIDLAGNEMLASGMNKVAVRNLLSAYGYYEDWIPDYLDVLSKELKGGDEDAELAAMIAKAEDELSPEMYKNQDFPGGLSENENVNFRSPQVLAQIVANEFGDELKALSDKEKQDMALSRAYEKILASGHPKAKIIARNLVWGYADEDWPSDYISALYDILGRDLNEAKKKKEKKELNPNQIHPQELRMGIKVEMEHTDNLDKAKKIALDHLAENPFYYTALKLAGVESPSAPKAKVPVAFKKEVAAETELVDKINAMKPVKGFEKAKASSNKASKETNSVIKGVEELTHNAKSVRGLQKFAATGGKMKTIKLKEDYESFLSQKRGEEAAAKEIMQATNADGVKFSVNDMAVAPDGKKIKITGFTTGKDGKIKAMYSTGMFADVYNLDDLEKKPSFRPGVDLGKYDLKSMLEKMVREVMNEERADGGDDMNPQYAQDEIK